jgi:hypothetical protein
VQTEKIKTINKGCLKDVSKNSTEINVWFGDDEFNNKLMKQRIKSDDSLIERAIRVDFVDIPKVYHYNDDMCDPFFEQLADTDQYEVF